jgi:hypothetical protein
VRAGYEAVYAPLPMPVVAFDGVDTQVANVNDMKVGDYVVLPPDVDEEQVPLLVDGMDPRPPVLWQVTGWPVDEDDAARIRFEDSEGDCVEVWVDDDDQVRWVLPGQDHETWETPPVVYSTY